MFIANVKKMQDVNLIKTKSSDDCSRKEKQAQVPKRMANPDVSSHLQKKAKLIPGDLKQKMSKWLNKQPKSICSNTSFLFSFKVGAV